MRHLGDCLRLFDEPEHSDRSPARGDDNDIDLNVDSTDDDNDITTTRRRTTPTETTRTGQSPSTTATTGDDQ